MRFIFVLIFLIASATSCLADDRPNIVVFYSDDHGHADLSCQGVLDDIRTPNVDALARSGVRAIHGYSTAPQCIPSRAGLLVGKFQAKFGVEANGQPLDGFNRETLVFYIGDNGAPLKIHKHDAPGGGPGWDGSLNTPLNGEKGMLSEGGIHTPFVVAYPGTIPGGQQYPHPVSALDVAATATSIAKVKTNPEDLDGINLIPFLSGENTAAPHDALMWRWIAQAAIREGDWKLLRGGEREYLYNLKDDLEEKHNVAADHPEIADKRQDHQVVVMAIRAQFA